ncbi:CoA transferase subunit A [Deinococcus maricopensis]|uniref:3-oxoacid CoA-transferase, A subunit n=1 Tax=Deinococcus maricopensis (strain DSM 21211 / LMG 22137 / NRRL B-23946 / LB-34) TaxID=709986 RepID=E8U393_DEIML|nr:CoA transferase subunit A [Deinococcus maricopensis]ADV66038.1 3-oxoacid CoA-transferase, A subunit [Deinococcus maricopensis DSM 21211]
MNKVYDTAEAALQDVVRDGVSLAVGGFASAGVPTLLLGALRALNVRALSLICCSTQRSEDFGVNLLLTNRQVTKLTTSYLGPNDVVKGLYVNKELQVELVPQGTLAERLRAGGAGIPAFFTPVGAGTVVQNGKETREIAGHPCILEEALVPDVGFVKAWRADRSGNLVYRRTAQNFNPQVAAAARVTIAEVEEIVDVGQIDPDHVHTPGVYVQRVVLNPHPDRTIRNLKLREDR